MAISSDGANKILASDILNLENNSINTGRITCSSIECTGQIAGEFSRNKKTLVRIGYLWGGTAGSIIETDAPMSDYDLIAINVGGWRMCPFVGTPELLSTLTGENTIAFSSKIYNVVVTYVFVSYTQIKIATLEGEAQTVSTRIFGIKLF